ncbi:hypothetical protein XENOCAPTIV_010422 [Xenoophorus captivus]|uniref:Uncharacterized protein n=1 Tax=Xenoophorus captivus TaxID=1517983 RepID=A0ABV0Q965_9TELE
MDRISRCSQGPEGIWLGNQWISTSCWPPLARTYSVRWGDLQPSVKQLLQGIEDSQDTLEGLSLSDGLGMPCAPPVGAGGGVWGEGSLGDSTESAFPVTQFWIKQKMISTSTTKD